MPRSLRVSRECIEKAKLALQRNGFHNQRALAEGVGLALSTVSNFFTGRPVDYTTFVSICDRLQLDTEEVAELETETQQGANLEVSKNISTSTINTSRRRDWGEAIDVSTFYGRTDEIATLEQWIVADRCRLITIIGMGGIGKTALSAKVTQQVADEFECLIWRSLRNAPPIQELLAGVLCILSNQKTENLPDTIDTRISLLLQYMRTQRCLLVLDNVESILYSGGLARAYLPDYEGYGQLLRCIGESNHQSCLVLTSREKPKGLSSKEGINLPIRSLRLSGLQQKYGSFILQEKGFAVSENESQVLIEHYAGNPLALKIIGTTIQEIFNSNISRFLEQGSTLR